MCTLMKFSQMRRDGTIIHPGMAAAQILALSGTIVKVVRTDWVCDGKPVSVQNTFALASEVSTSGSYVANIFAQDEADFKTQLRMMHADGTIIAPSELTEINGIVPNGN